MADTGAPTSGSSAETPPAAGGPRGKDEVALELMKFIAVTTGYGRTAQSSAGFSGKMQTRSSEEQVDALLGLFERCRQVVGGS